MLSNKEIVCPDNLLNVAHKKRGIKAGIVNAGKPLPMLSVQDAVNENLIEPIFIGDEKEILKCAEDLKWDISDFEIIHEPVENNTAAIAAKLASEKKIRIIVNILFSGLVFAIAFYSGFYPLSLLLFLSLYDLRSLQRLNLPINKSRFIPYENIEEVKLIKGILRFNYAHIIINVSGRCHFRNLKVLHRYCKV